MNRFLKVKKINCFASSHFHMVNVAWEVSFFLSFMQKSLLLLSNINKKWLIFFTTLKNNPVIMISLCVSGSRQGRVVCKERNFCYFFFFFFVRKWNESQWEECWILSQRLAVFILLVSTKAFILQFIHGFISGPVKGTVYPKNKNSVFIYSHLMSF